MFLGDVKAGQVFYYSVNYTPNSGSGMWIPGIFTGSGSSDWASLAQRVASAAGAAGASASVVGSGEGNITLNVTSSMDRASMDDLRGNLDGIVAQQPEVANVTSSVIRLISSPSSGPVGAPGTTPGGGGFNFTLPGPLGAGATSVASSFGLSQQQLILIVGGLALLMFLKR